MRRNKLILLIAILISGIAISEAQETEIGTEEVTVVKPYSPSVSDAFKIKSVPGLIDSIVRKKKRINYSIFSVPVASTFTPAKGRAAGVEKAKPEELFNSYASVGLGNYNNALVDFYTSREIDRGNQRLDIGLNHFSSRGDIDDTPLNTDFYNTDLSAYYTKNDRDFTWGANLNAGHQLYNWYGLPETVTDPVVIEGIDEKQQYFKLEGGAYLKLQESPFKKGEIQVRRFWDEVESAENRLIFQSVLEFPVTEENLTLTAGVDYLGGSFQNALISDFQNLGGIDYGFFQANVNPSLNITRDNLTLNLGANITYGLDTENSESNFYIYPAVRASYRLLDEVAIAYGGVEGELRQNSYHGFVSENPFLAPALVIQPTDHQYDAYVGLKGQLLPNLSYNIKGTYTAENRRPLFKLTPENTFRSDDKGYFYGNSFELFYDDIKTLGIFGEINIDVNRNFSLGVNAEIFDYDTETDNPAWNLPNLQGSLFLDYQIGEKWFLGANLFYVGEREDLSSQVVQNVLPEDFPAAIVELDGFFDANAHVGYRFNNQLSIFAKASNLANNQYQRWANFRVQGFQVLAGATYKFDF